MEYRSTCRGCELLELWSSGDQGGMQIYMYVEIKWVQILTGTEKEHLFSDKVSIGRLGWGMSLKIG